MRFAKKIAGPHTLSGALIVIGFVWIFFISPGPRFPTNQYFTISEGETLATISHRLKENGLVRSPLAFKGIAAVIFLSGNNAVAGDYFFEKRTDAFSIAWRIIHGKFVKDPLKITIPEGLTKFETAAVIKKIISEFDLVSFVNNADEGYIFPDTYFFPKKVGANDVIRLTRKNFEIKIDPLREKITAFDATLPDIIKMASIIELEASDPDTRRIIAGILWKRLAVGMPLQVDVSFNYINGKNSFELTSEDLNIDSAYNSYKYAGLPPTPIGNPSLDAIVAALEPTKTKYFYYVSDKTGVTHYAATFEEHKKNKEKYLR